MQPVRVYKEFLAFYSKSACWALRYSSGLLPWREPGMLNMRTRWVVSSSVALECLVEL
jgi:hypothetical protein